jgi:hypothetical protein
MDATTNEPSALERAITLLIVRKYPKLDGHITIHARPRAPYIYHAHRADAGTVIVHTSITFDRPLDLQHVETLGQSCLEVYEGRTSASRVGIGLMAVTKPR